MGDFCMVFNEQVNMSEPVVSQNTAQAIQGNHINANNGNGGNNNNGNNVRSTGSAGNQTSINVVPPAAALNSQNSTTPNSSGKQKSPANPPSKSYVRKPINKK